MSRFLAVLLAFIFIAICSVRADEGPDVGPEADSDDTWQYRGDLLIRGNVLGNEPSLMFSEDSPNRAVSSAVSPLRAEVRGRIRAFSRYLHVEIEPYTWVPQAGFYVTVAGIEYRVLTPLMDRLRLGFYHHSSHNFSDGAYGRGISLNAVMVDGEVLRGEASLFSSPLRYRVHGFGHVYLPGSEGSAYEFAGGYGFDPSGAGRTSWRAGVDVEIAHPYLRAECSASTASERLLPVSSRGLCHVALSPGRRFLGSLGQHVFAGPFVAYRANFMRKEEFGGPEIIGGLLFDLVVAENTF